MPTGLNAVAGRAGCGLPRDHGRRGARRPPRAACHRRSAAIAQGQRCGYPDGGRRSYSLIETASPRAAAEHPTAYRIAVLQESKSRGGSSFMHGLKTGDRLTISPPANNFPIGAGTSEVALVAGGIGVTPLLAMACELS